MNLIQSKVLSIVILGVFSFLVGVLPYRYARQGRSQCPLLLSCLLCFGGGVLLSTALVHILPELRESVPLKYQDYTEIVFCGGFFILYIIDEMVHLFHESHEEESVSILHNHEQVRELDNTTYGAASRRSVDPEQRALTRSLPTETSSWSSPIARAQSDSALLNSDDPPSQLCHVGHQEPCNVASTTNLGLLSALSIHALLEGLVVGLEQQPEKVLLLLGAVASHKLVVSFCLGMELASSVSISTIRHFIYIFIFTIGSVGGIIVGMLITNVHGGIKNVLIPILQGFAGGTLLYVSVSEVLPRERARWHQQHEKKLAGMFQFFSVFIGFVLMTILSKLLES